MSALALFSSHKCAVGWGVALPLQVGRLQTNQVVTPTAAFSSCLLITNASYPDKGEKIHAPHGSHTN